MEVQQIQDMKKRSAGMMGDVFREYWSDRKFHAGDQWEGKEQTRLNGGRQSVVFNRLPGLIHPVVNAVKQAPPAILILPLGGGANTDKASRIAARIRILEKECRASRARLYALQCASIGGVGVWRTIPKNVRGKIRSVTETILDPTTVYPDSSSQEPDFSDARWIVHEHRMHRAKLASIYDASRLAENYRAKQEAGEDLGFKFGDDADEMVSVLEAWYLDEDTGKVCRCVATDDEVLARTVTESVAVLDDFGAVVGSQDVATIETVERFEMRELPYSFVVGDFELSEDGVRHYTSIVRFAKPDQIAVNYAENEWISDIVVTPKTKWVGEPDAVEGYEEKWKTAHLTMMPFLPVKDLEKMREFAPPDLSSRFLSLSQSHRQSMVEVTGVSPTTGPVLDPVSGKSVKFQQAQAAVSSFHYVDALHAAIEHDGRVYLDVLRVYENDDEIRPVLLEDGRSIARVSFGPTTVEEEGVENVDLEGESYGVAVSVGPAYGSQLEQIQDLITGLCERVPSLAPVLLPLILRRIAIPESEDVNQILALMAPPNVQAMLAQKGDKGAQLAQLLNQAQQSGAMVQQLQQQLGQLAQALNESQQALANRGAIQDRDNAAKLEIERIRGRNDQLLAQEETRRALLLEHERGENAQELEGQRAGHRILTDFHNHGLRGVPGPRGPFDHTFPDWRNG